MIYNDAYSIFAGGRHPHLFGSKVREGWPEVADFNDNVMKVGLSGGTLSYRNQELTLHRSGVPEQVWMNLDYSPVLDEEWSSRRRSRHCGGNNAAGSGGARFSENRGAITSSSKRFWDGGHIRLACAVRHLLF